jgi:hypothetical protein
MRIVSYNLDLSEEDLGKWIGVLLDLLDEGSHEMQIEILARLEASKLDRIPVGFLIPLMTGDDSSTHDDGFDDEVSERAFNWAYMAQPADLDAERALLISILPSVTDVDASLRIIRLLLQLTEIPWDAILEEIDRNLEGDSEYIEAILGTALTEAAREERYDPQRWRIRAGLEALIPRCADPDRLQALWDQCPSLAPSAEDTD